MAPRRVTLPDYPDTAGGWLATFRYRARNAAGHPMTVEQLGDLVGVSGATVRRWELGSSRPRVKDVWALAEVLQLTPIETAFLDRAFRAGGREDPPSKEVFAKMAARLLDTDNPALILDGLFFIRARNSLSDLVLGPGSPDLTPHPFFGLDRQVQSSVTEEERLQRRNVMDRWVSDFWNATARLCGSEAYRILLHKLEVIPGFARAWYDIGLKWHTSWEGFLGGPYFSDAGPNGLYRVLASRVFTPALYYFIEYVPVDEQATKAISHSDGESRVLHTSLYRHWSFDPYLSE